MGPSINDVIQEREEGVPKVVIWGDFQGIHGLRRIMSGSKNYYKTYEILKVS